VWLPSGIFLIKQTKRLSLFILFLFFPRKMVGKMVDRRHHRTGTSATTDALPLRELRDHLQAGVKELGGKDLGARTRLVALLATKARGKGGGASLAAPAARPTRAAPDPTAEVPRQLRDFLTTGGKGIGASPAPAARPTRAAPDPTAGVPRQLRDFLTAGASEILGGSRRRTVKNSFGKAAKRDVSSPTPRPRAEPEERATVAVKAGRPPRAASKPARRPSAAAPAAPPHITPPSDGTVAEARVAAPSVVSVGIPLPEHWPTPLLPTALLLSGAALRPASPDAVALVSAREAPCTAPAPQQQPPRGKAGARAKRCVCRAADKSKWSVACKGCDRVCHGECVGADPALHHPERAALATPPPPRRGKRKAQEEPGEWHCRGCLARLKRRRREEAEFDWADRAERYCVCARPWDGSEFMIACDECSVWYHGVCVGISVSTIEAGTQAAFHRYVCPKCAPPPVAPGQGVRLYAEDAAPAPGSKAAGKLRLTPSCAAFSNGGALSVACNSAGPSGLAWLAEAASAMRCGNTPEAATGNANTPPPPGRDREEASPSCIGLLDALSDDCLAAVLAQLPLPSLLRCAVPLSRRVAELAEPLFRAECEARGWKLQRRLAADPCAWRRTLRARSCAVCLARAAPFSVRRPPATATAFRLCATCARRDDVHEQLDWHSLEVDTVSEQGQPLFSRQFHTPLFGHADGFSQRSIQRG